MAIIKCKMCGGDLRIEEGSTVCECEYCGTRQTVPSADNEKKLTLFSRAGRLLRGCEFDKAAGVFETIVADFPEEAEAYWGLVLCKYGIEYVDDPATGKKIPTCHRSSFDSVLDDPNFEQACENTDALARRVYRDEARQIEDLRKQIIEVSGKEEPYDIFISYKETDEHGDRTLDSVIAQDIYTELTEKGYRVFFARISLEDKLGTEYEPYIFAALNSAKVMLVVGTDYENFDSVWVKNEWSRFLKLIASGQKKTLIPVFKNMDAYDMPKEFAKLAAQDMGKVGAMQDLVRGVEKLVPKKEAQVKETVIVQQSGGPNIAALLKRGQQALEDGDWDKAKDFFDQVLSMDAENSEAFSGLFLTGVKCTNGEEYIESVCSQEATVETLSIAPDTERVEAAVRQYMVKTYLSESEIRSMYEFDLSYPSTLKAWQAIAEKEEKRFSTDRNLVRAVRYAKNDAARPIKFKAALSAALEKAVREAEEQEKAAAESKRKAYEAFLDDAEEKVKSAYRKAQDLREYAYQDVVQRFEQSKNLSDCQSVRERLLSLAPYRDSTEMIMRCDEKIVQIKQAEAEENERQRVAREKAEKAAASKKKRTVGIILALAAVAIAALLIYTMVIAPGNAYKNAETLLAARQYEEAILAFEALGDYKDSAERLNEARYAAAKALMEEEKYEEAILAFKALEGYKDSAVKIEEANKAIPARDYAAAISLYEAGNYEKAINAFSALGDYEDSADKIIEVKYAAAEALFKKGQYEKAIDAFSALGDYKDSADKINEVKYAAAEALVTAEEGARAAIEFYALGNYRDAKDRSLSLWAEITQRNTISAGDGHTVGLKEDGTVIATEFKGFFDYGHGERDVSSWRNIVAVDADSNHSVGIKADGTVVAVGFSIAGECDVSGWRDIVAVDSGVYHTVGLKADGTVIATKYKYNRNFGDCGQFDVSEWRNIVAVGAGTYYTVGLKTDGTVVVAGQLRGQSKRIFGWSDITTIAAGAAHVVGLKADGTVVAVGANDDGQCNVSGWTDIVAIAAGRDHTVGLKADGTVVAVGGNSHGPCNVSGWKNIVAISAGSDHTVGLKADGTVVATKYTGAAYEGEYEGQCDVSGWTDIKLPNT